MTAKCALIPNKENMDHFWQYGREWDFLCHVWSFENSHQLDMGAD